MKHLYLHIYNVSFNDHLLLYVSCLLNAPFMTREPHVLVARIAGGSKAAVEANASLASLVIRSEVKRQALECPVSW